jgi:hypothetical protein
MPASMRSRLCSRFRSNVGLRAAGDDDDAIIAAGTVDDQFPSRFDLPILDGLTFDLSILDRPFLDIAAAIATQDNDDDDDNCAGNDSAGRSFAIDDTAAAGRPLRCAEGGHNRPFGVSVAPPACGHALRL